MDPALAGTGRDDDGMKRIAVVGPGGAGKSTFARELGMRTGLPVVHLDRRYWRPGWVETPREAWAALQAELFSEDRWIADGNYGGTFDVRFARADTVIVLALPRLTCLVAALRRSLRNRGTEVQAAGCPERVDFRFLQWIWRYEKDSRPRLDAALARHRGASTSLSFTPGARSRRSCGLVPKSSSGVEGDRQPAFGAGSHAMVSAARSYRSTTQRRYGASRTVQRSTNAIGHN